jgi:hypothetical protein
MTANKPKCKCLESPFRELSGVIITRYNPLTRSEGITVAEDEMGLRRVNLITMEQNTKISTEFGYLQVVGRGYFWLRCRILKTMALKQG